MSPRVRRSLPVLLAALPVLAVLLSLGVWQGRRLAWKTDLLERIALSEAGPAVPLTASPAEFTKVRVTGRFLHEREALLGSAVRGNALGARLVTPLEAEGLPPVMVDRGWVPVERQGAAIARPAGVVTVTGYVSPPQERDVFAARDDAAGRRFFTADPAAIGAGVGLAAVMTEMLVALAEPGAPRGALPAPAETLPRPANSHLGYAITWYGLAAALVGVVIAWIIRKEPT